MRTVFTLLFAVPLLLVGCTTENSLGIDPISPSTEAVPMIIESAAIAAQVETRGVLNTGSIGVFLSGTGYTAINNREYNYSSPSWSPSGGAVNNIYLGGGKAEVCAYYPFNSLFSSTLINLSSKLYAEKDDISFAINRDMNGSSSGRTTIFNMQRAYAKLTFTFQRSNYSSSCVITKLLINNGLSNYALNIGAGFNGLLPNGVSGLTYSESTNITVPPTGTIPLGHDILLVPSTPASTGIQIVVTVDGSTMSTTIPTASYKPTPGEYKNIQITIRGSAIEVSSVTTTDWTMQNIGPYFPDPFS